MRTVYVITSAPTSRAQRARYVALLILARIVGGLIGLGHLLVQLVGAADAIVTAVLGIPRLAVLGRRFAAAVRQSREA